MSMRNLMIAAMFSVLAGPLAAHAEDARKVAEVPPMLEGTGERAPMPTPMSSAKDPGMIDAAQNHYGIGQPATADEIAAVAISVMPDGHGAPEGSGTYGEGEKLYAEVCAACHGDDMMGSKELGAPRLIGGRGTLATDKPVKTIESYWPYASTVYDYVHRAMPMNAPGSLEPDQVYAITAYILGRAGITGTDPDTRMDGKTLAGVKMPNADGFVPDPRPDVK